MLSEELYGSIPESMKQCPNWLVWKLEPVTDKDGNPQYDEHGRQKLTKPPYSVHGGKASTTNPKTWATFDEALDAFRSGQYSGIGFVFTGTPFVGIDVDHCIDPLLGEELCTEACDIANVLNSYTERSQSGTGIHIIVEGKLPEGRRKNGAFEMYGDGSPRYFAMTGDVLGDAREIRADQDAINAVHVAYIQPPKAQDVVPIPTDRGKPHCMDNREIVRKAEKARNGFLFRALWAGDTSNHKSPSEADQALSNILAFWCGKDARRMDELFRQSGLYRPKWDEKHGPKTYGEMTIDKAIADCTAVYDPDHRRQRVHDDFASSRYDVSDLPSYKPDDMTDTGNSRMFAKSVADRLIWLDGEGFRRWNGTHWELNPNAGLGMGKVHTDRMLDEAGSILTDVRQRKAELEEKKAALGAQDITGAEKSPELTALKTELDELEIEEKQAGAYYAFALNSRSKVRINAFVELAKPDILIDSERLNADPFALNTPSGIVDVRTGIVRPHDPMEYCTSITTVSPSDEGMELWWEHLRLVTCDSPDLMRFHQEVAGMALIGRVFMENLFMALGDGANGKSTLYNVQLMVLGPGYAGTINPEVLTTDKRNAGADFATLNIWTLDSKGELLLTIMASIAQEESRNISENVTWGQRRRVAEGKVSLPYSAFLGYRKGPDNLPEIVPEEAKIVKMIYHMYLSGKSAQVIADALTSQGIPTPRNRAVWSGTTIHSILTNEKYKGEALLQKTFTVDFLTKKKKVNEGEVPQVYVTGSHPAIIPPDVFDIVQDEVERRKRLGRGFSGKSIFASRIICGECGGYYGSKVWHSNSPHKRRVWQCNHKYDKGKRPCSTTHLTENELQAAFMKVFNERLRHKDVIIAACRDALSEVLNVDELEQRRDTLNERLVGLGEIMRKMINRNARSPQDQAEYNREFEEKEKLYCDLCMEKDELENEISDMKHRAGRIAAYLRALEQSGDVLAEFDPEVWVMTVESITVHKWPRIVFRFRSGQDVEGTLA